MPDLYENFQNSRKRMADAKESKKKDKLARGADLASFVGSFHAAPVNQERYREGWERIWGKKKKTGEPVPEKNEEGSGETKKDLLCKDSTSR